MNDKPFHFYIPAEIEKASNTEGGEIMKFKGIASTNEEDTQGEFLDPAGFDLTSFKFVNWNHLGSKDSSTIIGEPTKAVIDKNNQLYVEGILFPEVAMAKSTWALMKALQNSPSGNKLGISVEGKAISRGCGPQFLDKAQTITNPDFSKEKWNRITKAKITSIALCPTPINGNTWAGIMKGEMGDSLIAVYDSETEATLNETIDILDKTSLKKSEVFELIYEKSPEITIEKAKSVYKLIEKIATTMNTETNNPVISDETISKAFEILNLASTDISKSSDKNKDKPNPEESPEEEEDEDEKEMVKKASDVYKAMSTTSSDKEAIKAALVKKGYGDKVIEKAMACESNPKESLSKAEVEDIIKSSTSSLAKSFDEKINAVSTVLTRQLEINVDLQKSLDDSLSQNNELNSKLTDFLNKSKGPKSTLITKSYQDRFGSEEGVDNNSKKFNIQSSADRKILRDLVTERSGIAKGENFDVRLTNIAQELEIAQTLSATSISILKAMDIEVLGA